MPASITFFPVGNGDMTLIELDNGQRVLIDINVRGAADDDNEDEPDVMSLLRDRLNTDGQGRPYVDAFLLSHPDKDHVTGLEKHFHLGSPSNWSKDDDKILINEMWSSPLIFRRADEADVADGDPKAWWDEARRRVHRFRENGLATEEGERILILGEDRDGKTDDLEDILVSVGSTFSSIDRVESGAVEVLLLGPLAADDEDEEEELSKNNSSVVARFAIRGSDDADPVYFLTGGDAGVVIWERLWDQYGDSDELDYDILQTPHHCSWRSLSHDSESELGQNAAISASALSALGQALEGAQIVASSKPILADDDNPPSDRARSEYVGILDDEDSFHCVADHWDANESPLEIVIDDNGATLSTVESEKTEFKSEGLAASAAAFGISAAEQKARAAAAVHEFREQGRASKPYAEDDG